MRKPEPRGPVAGMPAELGGQCDLAACPSIVAFLTDEKWDDGSKRQTGTILLMVQDSLWKAWVNDKAMGRSAFVSGESLRDLLDVLNDGIELDQLDWRKDRGRPQGRGR